jgi:hypothetical protein
MRDIEKGGGGTLMRVRGKGIAIFIFTTHSCLFVCRTPRFRERGGGEGKGNWWGEGGDAVLNKELLY